jgi:hypothetical protein
MTCRFALTFAVMMGACGPDVYAAEPPVAATAVIVTAPGDVSATQPEPVGPQLPRPIAEAAENDRLRRTLASPSRPRVLTGLYVSLAGLNALDIYSTMRALDSGARELNPVMGSAGHPGASFAIKAATTAGAIYLAEKLWKRNRVAAIVTMVAVNAGTAAVVARNLRNTR